MLEGKKQLEDEQLEQVSGGGQDIISDFLKKPKTISTKYEINYIVATEEGWQLQIVGKSVNSSNNTVLYRTTIVHLPSTYHGSYKVGDSFVVNENRIVTVLDVIS